MGIAPVLRTVLLVPFGGEGHLLEAAEGKVGRPPAATRLYSGARFLSTGGGDAAVSFLFEPGGPDRSRKLAELTADLRPGRTLVALDHNAPRRSLRRALASLYLGAARPWLAEPVGRRLRRPIAQELQALGLDVVCLRLLAGELFQAVLARRPG